MRVFITGDRQASPALAGQVAMQMLSAAGTGREVMTGTSDTGVEAFVRTIGAQAGFPVEVVENPRTEDGQYVDWDARHQALADAGDVTVVGIHGDPQSSRILRSVIAVVPDERVELRSPVDFLEETPEEPADF